MNFKTAMLFLIFPKTAIIMWLYYHKNTKKVPWFSGHRWSKGPDFPTVYTAQVYAIKLLITAPPCNRQIIINPTTESKAPLCCKGQPAPFSSHRHWSKWNESWTFRRVFGFSKLLLSSGLASFLFFLKIPSCISAPFFALYFCNAANVQTNKKAKNFFFARICCWRVVQFPANSGSCYSRKIALSPWILIGV